MRRKISSRRKKVVRIPFALFIIAIIALAIPITVMFSQQQTNFLQFAAKKHRNGSDNKNNNNKNKIKNNNNKNKNKNNSNNNQGLPTGNEGEQTNLAIPGGVKMYVYDYSNPNIWGSDVEIATANWSKYLQGGASLIYVRKPFTYCKDISGVGQPEDSKWNIIEVCSTVNEKGNIYGRAWVYHHLNYGNMIHSADIELKDRGGSYFGPGDAQSKLNTVCHELGHAVGIEHNASNTSCVNDYLRVQIPGAWDSNTLKKSYRGTLPIPPAYWNRSENQGTQQIESAGTDVGEAVIYDEDEEATE